MVSSFKRRVDCQESSTRGRRSLGRQPHTEICRTLFKDFFKDEVRVQNAEKRRGIVRNVRLTRSLERQVTTKEDDDEDDEEATRRRVPNEPSSSSSGNVAPINLKKREGDCIYGGEMK